MAVRARPDNLALDHPAAAEDASTLDFQELWAHRDDLRAVSRRLVGDEGTADDVVQETYLRWLTNARRLDRRASFAPWLATVARRRSLDRLRAEARTRPMAALPERSSSIGDDPLEQVLGQERVDRVRAALAELSTRERQLLLRQTAHGLSLAELAAEEATSIASVRSVLSRARAKLRLSLEQGGPLGAAPAPGLVAAVKRRLHRWAARWESSTPMLFGASAQFGDVVAAAVAAAVLLLAGGVPAPEQPTTIAMASATHASDAGSAPGPAERRGPEPTRDGDRRETSPDGPEDERAPDRPVVQPPSIPLPGQPADGADQPEETLVQHIAASSDGHTVVISGRRYVPAGSTGGNGLYRSDDGGHTWRQLQAGGSFVGGRPVLPPGFRGQRTLFMVANPLLLRSDDGGDHFEPVASTRGDAATLAADPGDGRIFLAPAALAAYDPQTGTTTAYQATPVSMWVGGLAVVPGRSPDRPSFVVGSAVQTILNESQGYVQRCTPSACDPVVALPGLRYEPYLMASSSRPGLVVAWRGSLLYRSTDGGRTFASVPMPDGVIQTIVDGARGELLLARTNDDPASSGLLRSTDGGATWTPIALGTPLQQGAEGLAYLPTGRIVAGLDGRPGFRCSVDGGVTWAPRCPG